MSQHFFDQFLFVVIPYICLFTFLLMSIYRYRVRPFSYSSLSSQFLENKHHFWALVPFHYGILVVTAGHLLAFLLPRTLLAWNSRPWRLYVLEISALVFGILTLIGLVAAIMRRMNNDRVRMVTSRMDWLLFFYVVGADRQWSEHRPVLSLGVFLVCDKHVALPLVDFSARPRYYLRGCHALANQITYRVGISDDRVISLYTTRTCACDSQSLPVAEAASGALVQSPRGENVDIIP